MVLYFVSEMKGAYRQIRIGNLMQLLINDNNGDNYCLLDPLKMFLLKYF